MLRCVQCFLWPLWMLLPLIPTEAQKLLHTSKKLRMKQRRASQTVLTVLPKMMKTLFQLENQCPFMLLSFRYCWFFRCLSYIFAEKMTGVIIFTTVNINYVAVQLNCHSDSKNSKPGYIGFRVFKFFPSSRKNLE